MRVQTRLISLLLIISVIFVAGRYFFQVFEDKRMNLLFLEDSREKKVSFDNIVKLKGESLKTLAYDYTYWDEMVNFLHNNDMPWAQANMDENTLRTYQADAIWVYRLDLSPLYTVQSQNAADLKELPLPRDALNIIFSKERFCHFFVNTKAGLMEIRGATIHPTLDAARSSPPQGYFFAGRLWNEEYIGELAKFIGGKIGIGFTKQVLPPPKALLKANTIAFSRELRGWEGKPAAYVYVEIESKGLKGYRLFSRNAAMIFVLFLISVLIFVIIFLTISVSAPLNTISQALKTEKPVDYPALEKDTSEFGDILRLISRFFKQKQELVKEIAERRKAEEERENFIKELQEQQGLLQKQKKELEDSRRAIKNVAEDLQESKHVLEYQNQSLEDINKELDDFTYIVSHDLKEPLRSIDAYSKFIMEDYRDKMGEEAKHYLERIRLNADRMKKLIEDLLEISRLKSRGSIIEEVDTGELVGEVKMRLEYAIKQKGAEIIIKDKLPRIFCDRVRLGEAFFNLISNALKFNDKPKPVVEVGYNDKDDFHEFYVKDNGIGIKEEYFGKIFEIFQRLGKREDANQSGYGTY